MVRVILCIVATLLMIGEVFTGSGICAILAIFTWFAAAIIHFVVSFSSE